MAQLMAPAAAGALQAGVSFAAPDVAEAIVGSAKPDGQQIPTIRSRLCRLCRSSEQYLRSACARVQRWECWLLTLRLRWSADFLPIDF